MKCFYVALAVSLSAMSVAGQESAGYGGIAAGNRGLNPEAIEAIELRIGDNVSGACWTNLKEAREYAEEKLRIKGYNVVEDLPLLAPPNFLFWIGVGGHRSSSGFCDGTVIVNVQSVVIVDEFLGTFTLAAETSSFTGVSDNLNRHVIEEIKLFIDQM